ncbi:YheT family hydrolase [Comamonas composti]|uniref:YheT family hydrolase n=1 Tax=Comamonas composti TaxID=408558 RepID=UPI000558F170|nr:alpha/beta fold hydrolase [Comamonas composti]
MNASSPRFQAPLWLPGGHAQTIWAAVQAQRLPGGRKPPLWRWERWDTPDGDFIDVALSVQAGEACGRRPWLVLFHGLEGSAASHYALALQYLAELRGWSMVVPHFRGCGGQPNRAARAYHSGDADEADWILRRLCLCAQGPLFAVGVSLGGNVLARWAGLQGARAADVVRALAVMSAPLDLVAGGRALGRGLNRWIYTPMFLRTLMPKALAKWEQFPGLFDREAVLRSRDLQDFDDAFTAPVHGFRDALDYWHRASAKPVLADIRVPALLLNARNDPFVPAASLPGARDVGASVTLWQPEQGGHVGFVEGSWPGHVRAMPEAVMRWLAGHESKE